MGLSKSVISTRITNLETVLNVELLHRSTRGVAPTDKGAAFIVAKALASGQLINALPDACPVADTIYALYPRNRHLPKKVRAVIDHLVAMFEGEPPWERELSPA